MYRKIKEYVIKEQFSRGNRPDLCVHDAALMQKLDKYFNVCYDTFRNKFNNFVINLLRNGIILIEICFGGKKMAKSRRLFIAVSGLALFLFLTVQMNMTVRAGSNENLSDLREIGRAHV